VVQFYSNNETNVHQLTTHSIRRVAQQKWRLYCDHSCDVTSPYVYV